MDESKKKPNTSRRMPAGFLGMSKHIMIAVVVVCLVVAAVITYSTMGPKQETGAGTIDPSKMTWVKCRNPQCEVEYEIPLRDYYMYIEEARSKEVTFATPPLICKKCEEASVYKATKCEKCGLVFETGMGRKGKGDFNDRCPECGHSKLERLKKERDAGG